MGHPHPLGLNCKMPFGKYKGRIVKHVIRHDTKYITWGLKTGAYKFGPSAEDYYMKILNGETPFEDTEEEEEKLNPLAVVIAEQNEKGIIMQKKVVLVIFEANMDNHLMDIKASGGGKKYSFFTDDPEVRVGDIYCADCESGLKFVTVVSIDGLTRAQIERADAWLISKIDVEAHHLRLQKQAKAQEIKNLLDEGVKQIERAKVYQTMASINPSMGQLMRELHELDPEMMPAEMLTGLPAPQHQANNTAETEDFGNTEVLS